MCQTTTVLVLYDYYVGSFILIFLLLKLICKSGYICQFPIMFHLMTINFKSIMSSLFVETYIMLLIHCITMR